MKKRAKTTKPFKPVTTRGTQEEHTALVEEALTLDTLKDADREVFEEWLVKIDEGYVLSVKQLKWLNGLLEKPEYENLVSSGKVPRGREVATPAVLLMKPLKPPGRK